MLVYTRICVPGVRVINVQHNTHTAIFFFTSSESAMATADEVVTECNNDASETDRLASHSSYTV